MNGNAFFRSLHNLKFNTKSVARGVISILTGLGFALGIATCFIPLFWERRLIIKFGFLGIATFFLGVVVYIIPYGNIWSLISRNRITKVALIIIITVFTLFPIGTMLYQVINSGEGNLSNDIVGTVGLVDKTLNGQASLQEIFNASIGGKPMLFPFLIILILSYTTHWNLHVQLYIGFLYALLTLGFIFDTFTKFSRSSLRWWLLPFLSMMVFSPAETTTMTYETAIWVVVPPLGLALGIWALTRFPSRWAGLLLAVLGGLTASFSFSTGLIVWPLLFVFMIVMGNRKIFQYLALFCSALIGVWPSLNIPTTYSNQIVATHSYFNINIILNLLGVVWFNKITIEPQPAFFYMGCAGIGFLIVGLVVLLLRMRDSSLIFKRAMPALIFTAFGFLGVWAVTLTRTALAPWYNSIAVPFWIGLAGLSFVLWEDAKGSLQELSMKYKALNYITYLWSISFAAVLIFLYMTHGFMGWNFFGDGRKPVSVSCLRNYRTAPTYCESTVFLWGINYELYLSTLGYPLERNHLNVFAPQQQWSLQGDFILDTVRLHEAPDVPDIFWSSDLTTQHTSFNARQHLNLVLHSPNSVDWTIAIPENTRHVTLNTAITISQSAPKDVESDLAINQLVADGATFSVLALSNGQEPQTLFSQHLAADQADWLPITVPLDNYVGKTVTLRFTSQSGLSSYMDWIMLRYPVIDITVYESQGTEVKPTITTPSNTDLFSSFIKPSESDFQANPLSTDLWLKSPGLEPIDGEQGSFTIGADPHLIFGQPLDLCLSNYSHLYISFSASPEFSYHFQQVVLTVNQEGSSSDVPVIIPYLGDGQVHSYTYDLKLLELDKNARLTGILWYPVMYGSTLTGKNQVQLVDFRLTRVKNGQNLCNTKRIPVLFPIPSIPPEQIIGEIVRGLEPSQSFVSQCKGAINGIDLLPATYMRSNTPSVIFAINEVSSGNIIQELVIPSGEIKDNVWFTIGIMPLEDSYQKKYIFSLRSPNSTSGNAITIYKSQTDQYSLGEMYINGTLGKGDLVFRYHCIPN